MRGLDRLAVFQRDHAQVPSSLFNVAPETEIAIVLLLDFQRCEGPSRTIRASVAVDGFENRNARLFSPASILSRPPPDTFLATIPRVTASQPVGLSGAAVADRDVDPREAIL